MNDIIRDGRKIPRELENPIDNVLIDVAEMLNPTLRKLGVTPNMLTLCALVTGVLASYCVLKSKFVAAAILTLISYQFDCMDGNMARMFHMVSAFGDMLDHGSDALKYVSLYAALWYNNSLTRVFKIVFTLISIVFFMLAASHLGCQEKTYKKQGTDSLSLMEPLCPRATYITITRWFGVGTWVFVVVMLLLIATFNQSPYVSRS